MSTDRASFDEIYAACLDAIQSGQETLDSALDRFAQADPELRDMLEAALLLRNSRDAFAPRQGFVGASRRRLVDQIRQEQAAAATRRASLWERMASILQSLWRQPRLATALVVMLALIFSGAFAGRATLTATASAIPGDQIYPLKMLVEDARLVLTLDESIDARIHMEYADQRISEMEALVVRERLDYLPTTVQNYETHLNETVRLMNVVTARNIAAGHNLAQEFSTRFATQKDRLSSLASSVPETVLPDILLALTLSENGISAVETVLMQAEETVLRTPTPTFTASITLTSAPSEVAQSSATPGNADISATPSGSTTVIPTGEALLFPASTPTSTLGAGAVPSPSLTATPTPEPKSTRKPTNTPRPRPTRKPTKTPKP